jgi:hypothetical protein
MELHLDLMKAMTKKVRQLADTYDQEIPQLAAWIGQEDFGTDTPPFMKSPEEEK